MTGPVVFEVEVDDHTVGIDVLASPSEVPEIVIGVAGLTGPPGSLGTGGGSVDGIDDVPGLQDALDAKADEPVTVGDVTGLSAALADKADDPHVHTTDQVTALDVALAGKELVANKGAVNGYAPLDGSQLVPAIYLPSYVDDVLPFANLAALPGTGETGKIYVTLDTNKIYRWNNVSAYVEISSSPGSTDAVPEGSANLYYTTGRADGRIAAATGVTVQPYDATTTSYTSAEKTKLAGVASGAEVNVNADWNAVSGDALILNKPTIPAGGGGDVTLTGAQTITQKTVGDDLKFTSVATPAAPASGTSKLYNRTGVSGIDAMAYLTSIGVPIVLGRDVCFYARNTSGATIAKGSVVYASSATGTTLFIQKAQADATMTKLPALGIVTADVLNNTYGMVLQSGLIQAVDTSGMGDGATIYCSATTPGAFTTTAPTHPAVEQAVGIVVNSNVSGSILVTCCNAINLHRMDGTNMASFAVGDGTGAAAKTILFKNANTGTLEWTPTAARTLTLPDVTGTVLATNGTDVAVADGGTGRSTSTTAYGLIAAGTTATGAHQTCAAGATTEVLVGGGASALPVWTTASGSGAPVRATSPTLTNPTITNYTETVVAIGVVTTTNTLSLTGGTVQTATLTANTACTFTMPTATGGKSFVLYLKQPAVTGNGSATFTNVKWSNSLAPTITTTIGRMDILSFFADGTNWYGSFTQNYVY